MAYLHRQVHLGKDPLSVEARVKILEERKFADNVYKVNQKKKLLLFSSKRSPFSCVVIQLCLNVKGSLSCTNHICGWFLLAYGKPLVIATVALMSTIRSGLCFQISFISVWVFFFHEWFMCFESCACVSPVCLFPLKISQFLRTVHCFVWSLRKPADICQGRRGHSPALPPVCPVLFLFMFFIYSLHVLWEAIRCFAVEQTPREDTCRLRNPGVQPIPFVKNNVRGVLSLAALDMPLTRGTHLQLCLCPAV